MNITQNLVDKSKYPIKCPYEMKPEFIVVHNTANDAPAKNEIAYMIRNDKEVSFHYAIDDKEIVQGLPENRNGWHASDGEYGDGNRKGIAIEICYSESGGDRFINAEKLAAKFIAFKLKEKGWGIDKVKKHQDFCTKYCPHRTLNMGWQRFLDMVQAELNALKPTEKNENGVIYKVQVGAYSERKNAEAMVAKQKAAGFDAIIVTEGDPSEPADTPTPTPTPTVWVPEPGDTVYFKGGMQYSNANATTGETRPAGQAKITKIVSGKKHPYHLVRTGKTGPYGWVDADSFTKA